MSFLGMEPALQRLLDRIIAALPSETPIYLVGGAVRDLLLQRPIHDLDFVLPENAIRSGRKIARLMGADFYPLDTERDAGRVILSGHPGARMRLDFTRQRAPDIESDLRDRDFTINAIAIDLQHPDRLLDPCGGANDLLGKILRPCSPGSLINDPVRIMRAIRLSIQLNFHIPSATARSMREALPGLTSISPERGRDELFRILDDNRATSGVRLLDTFGVLAYILPELASLKGIAQPEPHFFDLWEHTLITLQKIHEIIQALEPEHKEDSAANWALGLVSLRLGRFRKELQNHFWNHVNPDRSPQSLLRLAALYHDTGKPQALQLTEKNRIVFHGHDLIGEQVTRARAAALRLSNQEIDRLGTIVRGHMRPMLLANDIEQPTSRAIYRFFRDLGAAGVDICLLSLADVLATYGPGLPQDIWIRQVDIVRNLLEAWWEHPSERISPPALLNGDDLMKKFDLAPGPKIGELLELIREAQAGGEINDIEAALALARRSLG